MILDGMRVCKSCNYTSKDRKRIGAWLPVAEFTRSKSKKDGYQSACKRCHARKERIRAGVRKRDKPKVTVNQSLFILNQAAKNLTSTSKGYYTYEQSCY